MRFDRILTSCICTTLCCFSFSALADEGKESGLQLLQVDWFSSGAAIQDLRDRSTKTFDLLDQNNSSSITFDEIDLSEMESEVPEMNNEELREYSRRVQAIQSKFMNWTTEFDEFEVVDTNGDGVWNRDEYELRRQNLQSHRLQLGLEEWDTDENGAVELHEFNSHLDELELLDEDADGIVSHKEAFKSENDRVISDVLMNRLVADEMVWTSYSTAAPGASTTQTFEVNVMRAVEVEKKSKE
ncbi:MAG: hypothetical protein F4X56_02505 [Gammaproteobacteria bacterium]|nr:hypothetical protein [Gammaproteobacteria bacterium]MXW07022.1 hypothetical protein [Gammaproteobacteria bacterium]MYC24772.1 hypothetical protein [Gammaproteobacteria bacterium]